MYWGNCFVEYIEQVRAFFQFDYGQEFLPTYFRPLHKLCEKTHICLMTSQSKLIITGE